MKEVYKLWKEGYKSSNGHKFEPIYVSDLGGITGRKTSVDGNGYIYFHYRGKKYRLHRAVAELFIPNPNHLPCVDHINTIRTDNRVSNLKWCSQRDNCNNPISIENYRKVNLGNKNAPTKKVKCLETGEIFQCTRDAAKKYNLSLCTVSNAANPNNTLKTAAGYHWEYIE